MSRLSNKTAVITGGGTGIGFATAQRYIKEGAFVYIFGRRQDVLDTAVASLGANARAVAGSIYNPADLDRLYAAIKAERGSLDIVFANAGAGAQGSLQETTVEQIDTVFDTNVKGTILTVQKALPVLTNGASVILCGSGAGSRGTANLALYSASKAAVRNLALCWAAEFKDNGVRVNVLSPGTTLTELSKAALGDNGIKAFAARVPLQRLAQPEDVAVVAAFLASSESGYMTASEVSVDGGLAQV